MAPTTCFTWGRRHRPRPVNMKYKLVILVSPTRRKRGGSSRLPRRTESEVTVALEPVLLPMFVGLRIRVPTARHYSGHLDAHRPPEEDGPPTDMGRQKENRTTTKRRTANPRDYIFSLGRAVDTLHTGHGVSKDRSLNRLPRKGMTLNAETRHVT